jgi:hypothetical protein
MGTARRLSRESGEAAHLYRETRYAAGTWDQRRRVIIKAEVVRHSGGRALHGGSAVSLKVIAEAINQLFEAPAIADR